VVEGGVFFSWFTCNDFMSWSCKPASFKYSTNSIYSSCLTADLRILSIICHKLYNAVVASVIQNIRASQRGKKVSSQLYKILFSWFAIHFLGSNMLIGVIQVFQSAVKPLLIPPETRRYVSYLKLSFCSGVCVCNTLMYMRCCVCADKYSVAVHDFVFISCIHHSLIFFF